MTDIVERLRTVQVDDQHFIKCITAAYEIERLREALQKKSPTDTATRTA